MFCENCGTEIKNRNGFCPNCGESIIKGNDKVESKDIITLKINKKILITIVLALVVAFIGMSLVMNNSSDNSVIGTWVSVDGNEILEFFEDGTCNGGKGPYYEATESGKLTYYDSYHYPYNSMYYLVKNNKLYISSDEIDTSIDYYYIRK